MIINQIYVAKDANLIYILMLTKWCKYYKENIFILILILHFIYIPQNLKYCSVIKLFMKNSS